MNTLKLLFSCLAILFANTMYAQLVLEYEIRSYDEKILLPLNGIVDVKVNWGDGTPEETFTTAGDKPHIYTKVGVKTVTVTGTLSHYGSISNINGNEWLIKVLKWDGLGLTRLSYAFQNAARLEQVPTTLPADLIDLSGTFFGAINFNQSLATWNTSKITNMNSMFYAAMSFNQNINNWNTEAVTDMGKMFYSAQAFNQPLDNWNTSKVTNMKFMFDAAIRFNQPLNNWNTSEVEDMTYMFSRTKAFNQTLDNWNTMSVTNMGYMFNGATAFNQPIGNWNTSKVQSMENMFDGASKFNQPIGSWNTISVTNMFGVFFEAIAFNQPLGSWNISNVSEMNFMFYGASLCTDNYDNLLNGWVTQNSKADLYLNAGASKYSSASSNSRDSLIKKGWGIQDAGIGATVDAKCSLTGTETSIIDDKSILYPNPVRDNLNIPSLEEGTLVVFNQQGEEVLKTSDLKNVTLATLPSGIYMYQIASANKFYTGKLVKE